MNKLEGIVKEVFKKILIPVGALSILASAYGYGQNNVKLHLQTTPKRLNVYGKILVKGIDNAITQELETDSTTGNVTFNLPNGQYKFTARAIGSLPKTDTLNISSDRNKKIQLIDTCKIKSDVYKDKTILDLMELMTGTMEGAPVRKIIRLPNTNIKVFYDTLDMPTGTELTADSVFQNTSARTGVLTFERTYTQLEAKIINHYRHDGNMPGPGGVLAWTERTPTSDSTWIADCYFCLDYIPNGSLSKNTYVREGIVRGLGFVDYATDTTYATHTGGCYVSFLADDEIEVLKRVYMLDNYTDVTTFGDSATTILTSVVKQLSNNKPESFKLYQNYPNPFNPETKIRYEIKDKSEVDLTVYDLLGREVKKLVHTVQSPGTYETTFSDPKIASGTYFYREEVKPIDNNKPASTQTKKMLYEK